VAPTGSSVWAAVDALLSSPRCANRHTRRAYTRVALLGSYIDAHGTPGFELDGTVYRAVSGYAGADEALLHMRAAAEMIGRLLPDNPDRP